MHEHRPTICILGSYGEGNVGDEAILNGILLNVHREHPDAHIVVFSHAPSETTKFHEGVTSYPMLAAGVRSFLVQTLTGTLRQSLYALKAADDIIIGGGGIFYDHAFHTGGKNPIKVWHIRCNTIRRLGKRYRIYGVGVSSLEKETSRQWMMDITENASSIAVRDETSRDNLKKIGVTKLITIVDDPALHLKAPKHTPSKSTPVIGMCVRQWYLDDPEKQTQLLKKLSDIASSLVHSLNAKVRFIPFSIGKDDDRVLMKEIVAGTEGTKSSITLSDSPHTVQLRLEEISNVDLLIGMRLHSIIFAHLTGTPWIALGYAKKVHDLAVKLGGESRYIDIEELSVDKIVSLANALLHYQE